MEDTAVPFSFLSNANQYTNKFKALSDEKRLHILHFLSIQGEKCVCDIEEALSLSQSKLSYHLGILLKAQLIQKSARGTWSYYHVNEVELDALLSEDLRCVFKPSKENCC